MSVPPPRRLAPAALGEITQSKSLATSSHHHHHHHHHHQSTTTGTCANTIPLAVLQHLGLSLLLAAEWSLYSAVPLCYIAHFSPVRDLLGPIIPLTLKPTPRERIMAWTAAFWAVYLSAVIVVSWLHHHELRTRFLRDMTAIMGVAGGLHYFLEGVARFGHMAVGAG